MEIVTKAVKDITPYERNNRKHPEQQIARIADSIKSFGLFALRGLVNIRVMKTHQMSKTRFYKIWKGLFTRCYNKNYRLFKDYGGRGIVICDRWHDFLNFKEDMYASYSDSLSIERINNDGDYSPTNCKWATRQEQNRNKRMHKLNRQKVAEIRARYSWGNGRLLAQEFGVTPGTISEIVNYSRNYARI